MADSGSFEELRDKRLRYVETARENGFEEGLRSLLADLYPDNAHSIYELLQNAEDAGATLVEFELGDHELSVTHDGARSFELGDIESITSIGNSTKQDDETQIGKFGVGFKAVFAYTTRPEIRSGDHCFAITDLFVPELIDGTAPAGRTTFRFPFDRAEKPVEVARAEVERGLRDLDEKTLLFLNNIQELTYELPGGDVGFVKRVKVDDLTIQTEVSQGESFVKSSWIRLVGPASARHEGRQALSVSAAFRLESTATDVRSAMAASGDSSEPSIGIVPLDVGDVSIYFPAVKESSGLRFHIHAPFASTVARDSVRDAPENTRLVADIGNLVVSHLTGFRDRGLIDQGFLAALPNAGDGLEPIYDQIRSAVVEAFNNEALTPVHGGGHRRALSLLSSPDVFREGLEESDLGYLLELSGLVPESEPRWANDFKDRQAHRFVDDLATVKFGWRELSRALGAVAKAVEERSGANSASHGVIEAIRTWHTWLETKEDRKILGLYQLLGGPDARSYVDLLKRVPLVRLHEGSGPRHVLGSDAYLPPTRNDLGASLVPVELTYFDEDESTKTSDRLRSFYKAAGVRRWDERARIDLLLQPYRNCQFPKLEEGVPPQDHLDDMKAFVHFYRMDRNAASSVFDDVHFVLVIAKDGRLLWGKPKQIFLDEPFCSTGLSALYMDDVNMYPLPGFYLEVEGIDDFLQSLGAASSIKIEPASVDGNPRMNRAWSSGLRRNWNTEDIDWHIERLSEIVETRDELLLRMLWNAVVDAKGTKARARYRANLSHEPHDFDSQLYQQLTSTAWVLDRDGELRRPREIALEEIRHGWRQPATGSLVHELGFGEEVAQRQAGEVTRADHASALGIEPEDAERLMRLRAAGVDVDALLEGALLEEGFRQHSQESLPGGASEDPDRRASVARLDARRAPIYETEIMPRSVPIGQSALRERRKAYLRGQYTDAGGRMYCQACRSMLPFKLDSGEWYFQATQFVGGLLQVHDQNALALCPLCAATYRHKRGTGEDSLVESLSMLTVEKGQETVEIPVLLNERVVRLRLTGKHAIDLKSAMAVAGEKRANGPSGDG